MRLKDREKIGMGRKRLVEGRQLIPADWLASLFLVRVVLNSGPFAFTYWLVSSFRGSHLKFKAVFLSSKYSTC